MLARELYPPSDGKTNQSFQPRNELPRSHSTASTQDHMATEPGALCSAWDHPVGHLPGTRPLGLSAGVRFCFTGHCSQGEVRRVGKLGAPAGDEAGEWRDSSLPAHVCRSSARSRPGGCKCLNGKRRILNIQTITSKDRMKSEPSLEPPGLL